VIYQKSSNPPWQSRAVEFHCINFGVLRMSRLPGGVFVGVVTLLVGLGFVQFELAKHQPDPEMAPLSVDKKPEDHDLEELQEMQTEPPLEIASDARAKS